MDGLLVAGIAISLALGLTLAALFLAVRFKRTVRADGLSAGVIVAELVDEASRRGEAARLNWSRDDLDAYGRVRPEAHDDLPTAVFPTVKDSNDRYRDKQ